MKLFQKRVVPRIALALVLTLPMSNTENLSCVEDSWFTDPEATVVFCLLLIAKSLQSRDETEEVKNKSNDDNDDLAA